jgi:hypothetical protein
MNDGPSVCAEMRERLLDADPAELRGEGDSTVALHLHDCARCAAAARRILGAQQELAASLSTLTDQAAATGRVGATVGMSRAWGRGHASRTSRTRRWLIGTTAPLAAAAVLVLVLVQRRAGDELPRLEPLPEQVAAATDVPMVNVTGNDDVAIMRTTNPNITVVWYLKRER